MLVSRIHPCLLSALRAARLRAILLSLSALGAAIAVPSMARADTLLYNLTFSSPLHTVGLPPTIGNGPAPRETVTDINFGSPMVVAARGVLNQQPLEFNTTNGIGDQVELDLTSFEPCANYTITSDLVIAQMAAGQEFTFVLDTPQVRNLHFEANGDVRIWVPGGANQVIGAWAANALIRVRIEVFLSSDTWAISLNGVQVYSGPFGGATELTALRLSTDVVNPIGAEIAAVDNLKITTTGCPLDGGCDRLTMGDLVLGSVYNVGSSFETDGVEVDVQRFRTDVGNCTGPTASGSAEIVSQQLACGLGREISVSNVTLVFDFGGTVSDLVIPYGEYGGTVSLSVNGDCAVVENFFDLDGSSLGGCLISVWDTGQHGQSCGTIRIGGEVDALSIGGQELWLDGLSYCRECEIALLRSAFEDRTNGEIWNVGQSMISGGALHRFQTFHLPDVDCSNPTNGGMASITNNLDACTDGLELNLNNINDQIVFLLRPKRIVLAYGEYGGNVNLSINGDCRNLDNLSDINGSIVGGVHVWAIDYGQPDQSCGTLYAQGEIDEFIIGGQEFAIDNVRACARIAASTEQPTSGVMTPRPTLAQNSPNPVAGGTLIRFNLPATGAASLSLYDVAGRQVRTLLSTELGAGPHDSWWDGRDDAGHRVPAGVYNYRLESGGLTAERRLIVLR